MPLKFFSRKSRTPRRGVSRRDLFRQGGLLTVAGALPITAERLQGAALETGGELYRSIGVHPLINSKGTFTIITGSQTLPEVKRAMDEASRSYVQMDELMQGVSQKLAELTGAPMGYRYRRLLRRTHPLHYRLHRRLEP